MKKHNVNTLAKSKNQKKLSMLTCYDYQSALAMNESDLDLILVGDSLGNVILGHDSTVNVTMDDMTLFGKLVRRGAPDKFIVIDLPFGSYASVEAGLRNACHLFQETQADAIKLEGANEVELEIIKRLSQVGVPVMAHIGLKPQRVKTDGGYFIQGKSEESVNGLIKEIEAVEASGAFATVLECIKEEAVKTILEHANKLTIGIGSGDLTDGQVLVINDLLGDSKNSPPSFCKPINNFYEQRLQGINKFIESNS